MYELQFKKVIERIDAIYPDHEWLADSEQENRELDEVLKSFAKHILEHTTPGSGSPLTEFKGLTIEQIVPLLPDMEVA